MLPASTSFFLKNGNKCGCSETTTGACSVTDSDSYVSYEIMHPRAGDVDWSFMKQFDYKALEIELT